MSIASKVIGLLKGVFGIASVAGSGLALTKGPINFPDGIRTAPSIAFTSLPTAGFWLDSTSIRISNSGTDWIQFNAIGISLQAGSFLDWNGDIGFGRVVAGVVKVTTGTSGSGWLQNSAGRSVLTADVTNDSATLATTGLTVTLKAGRKYSFLVYLYVTTGAVLEGVQAGLAGTATITNLLADVEVKSHASTPIFTLGRLTAFGTAIGQTVADAGNVQVELSGTIECNAAGTFRIDFAKNADTGALLTTVKRGSWLLVEDVP